MQIPMYEYYEYILYCMLLTWPRIYILLSKLEFCCARSLHTILLPRGVGDTWTRPGVFPYPAAVACPGRWSSVVASNQEKAKQPQVCHSLLDAWFSLGLLVSMSCARHRHHPSSPWFECGFLNCPLFAGVAGSRPNHTRLQLQCSLQQLVFTPCYLPKCHACSFLKPITIRK